MRRTDILDGNLSGPKRLVEFHGANRVAVHKTFNGLTGGRVAGAAVERFELEPVENRRVMAGGDHHAAHGALRLDGEGNRGRRRRLRCEHNLKTISGKNFSGGPGKTVGEKPAVETDDNFHSYPKTSDFGFRTSDFQ